MAVRINAAMRNGEIGVDVGALAEMKDSIPGHLDVSAGRSVHLDVGWRLMSGVCAIAFSSHLLDFLKVSRLIRSPMSTNFADASL